MRHAKCYIKDYPRPQFVRNAYRLLNGEWDFAFDYENAGESLAWFTSFPKEKRKINVPYTYQTELSGINIKDCVDNVWYFKSVDVGEFKDKRLALNFEGVDYVAKVWVNGIYVGTHEGGYDRFSFDITDAVQCGRQAAIVVKCEDTNSCTQPRGKQKWKKQPFGCWYTETTGIWKSVWLEATDRRYLESARITCDIDNYHMRFDFRVSAAAVGGTLKTVIKFGDETIAETVVRLLRRECNLEIDMTSEAVPFKVALWSEGSPLIYDAEFILCDENGVETDRVGSYCAMKKYGAVNNFVAVDNIPTYLRMTLDQGYFLGGGLTPPSEEAIERDVLLTKEMGFNGIRKHQKIEDERFYYYCDMLGVYVWLEMPSAFEYNDTMTLAFTEQWQRIIRQYLNHPCIMACVPFNESWGIQRVYADEKQQLFTCAIYNLTKAYAPDVLVISNDGWEHTTSDVVTLHNYAETGGQLLSCYNDMALSVADKIAAHFPHKFNFAAGYRYDGQPIILSEFAGIAFEKDRENGWGYGNLVRDEEAFFVRLEGQLKAIYSIREFAGFCITQTTDVEHEVNGLLYADRTYKVDKERLRKAILNL